MNLTDLIKTGKSNTAEFIEKFDERINAKDAKWATMEPYSSIHEMKRCKM